MNKSPLLVAGLFLVGFASETASATCAKEMEGKQFCLSGDMMKCVKIFEPVSKAFKYELYGVNTTGQSFSVNSPMYKKTTGYTPASCAAPGIAQK